MAVHVVPKGDSREHTLTSACECGPDATMFDPKTGEMLDETQLVHHPFDGNDFKGRAYRVVDDDGDPDYSEVV